MAVSQFSNMRDVRGYRAYQRLKLGWRLLSSALIGILCAPMLRGIALAQPFTLGDSLMSFSLALALTGSVLAASGSFGGRFRAICLFMAVNSGILLSYQTQCPGWGGLAWFIFPLTLFAGDRWLRREMGLAKGLTLVPPGCLLGLLVAPFFWPVVMVLGTMFLMVYLVGAYLYTAGALPRPQDLALQLSDCDPTARALEAITRI